MSDTVVSALQTAILINNAGYVIPGTDKRIFDGLNLYVRENETVTIAGLSGCGKTTFLKIAAGLIKPTTGDVFIENASITKAGRVQLYKIRQRTGFMFQDIALISNLNVYDNIALPLRYHNTGLSEEEISDKINRWFAALEFEKNFYSFPAELNISQKKIVGLIRAVVSSPKYLFLDEPSSNLDFHQKDIVKRVVEQIKNSKTTILMTTNNLKWASEISDSFAVLSDGKIEICGKYGDICGIQNKTVQDIIKHIGGDNA